ncbi:MAG: alpha-mannosidase [Promethearchaeota archaeon]
MKANKIIIVPTTHWDREWYMTFNEFRAYLVIMMDKLLDILKNDLNFKNFTIDGQVIPLEDYLEVRPEKKEMIEKFVKEDRLSIGPMYVLPDEFLVSGESIIRNLMLGHIIGRKFGKVMKAGYIPDPFGHIAQLPQILQGCEIPSMLFMRGFGNEFEENNLNMEFIWNAPRNSASILTIHLIYGYSSAANLNITITNGKYLAALKKIKKAVGRLEKYTATDIVLLNNGSDHLFAQPEVPIIIKQWNEANPDSFMEINDFENYVNLISSANPTLKSYEGELRGGKYHPLLSGVFSARIWIKQENTKIEYLYEKYAEPLSTITWVLDKYNKFSYPKAYLWTGLKWLLKNHPHDSICGCSIDEVHEEMKTRFQWSEQIANEITKNSSIYLSDLIKFQTDDEKIPIIIYNPLPWERKDISYFEISVLANKDPNEIQSELTIIDYEGNNINYQIFKIKEKPRFWIEPNASYRITFIAKVPACGYKVYYVLYTNPDESPKPKNDLNLNKKSIENKYFKVSINNDGQLDLLDKKSEILYENILEFEDVGDWGDEYDFSGPKKGAMDKKYILKDATQLKTSLKIAGPSQKTLKLSMILNLPISLAKDRTKREEILIPNKISVYTTLYKEINHIHFKIKIDNQSQDHRIRAIFSSKVKSEKVFADGHFYVIPRNIELPNSRGWAQKALPTNHQKDFVCAQDNKTCFAIFNKGLPEYEAIKDENGAIKLAITLLRCVGWLSRGDLSTRTGMRSAIAGPPLYTPKAQCLGKYEFDLSLCIQNHKKDFLVAEFPKIGKEFNNPLMTIIPDSLKIVIRQNNKLLLSPSSIFQIFKNVPPKEFEPYLPESMSFLEVDNKNVLLSALKKSEEDNSIIVRLYNLASNSQKANLIFYKGIAIKNGELVNLLEEPPKNEINAEIHDINENVVKIEIGANVIATFKLNTELK